MMHRQFSMLSALFVACLACSAAWAQRQGEEDIAWQRVSAEDSITGYSRFLKEFPDTLRKQQIRTRVDLIIQRRIGEEIRDRGAEVSERGINNSDLLPLPIAPGATMRFVEEIDVGVRSRGRTLILPDPTEPITFRGVLLRAGGTAVDVDGRGAVILDMQGKTQSSVNANRVTCQVVDRTTDSGNRL